MHYLMLALKLNIITVVALTTKGMLAWVLSGYIAVGTVWPNILILGLDDFFANLGGGGGYAWIIGASLGAVVHLAISKR